MRELALGIGTSALVPRPLPAAVTAVGHQELRLRDGNLHFELKPAGVFHVHDSHCSQKGNLVTRRINDQGMDGHAIGAQVADRSAGRTRGLDSRTGHEHNSWQDLQVGRRRFWGEARRVGGKGSDGDRRSVGGHMSEARVGE